MVKRIKTKRGSEKIYNKTVLPSTRLQCREEKKDSLRRLSAFIIQRNIQRKDVQGLTLTRGRTVRRVYRVSLSTVCTSKNTFKQIIFFLRNFFLTFYTYIIIVYRAYFNSLHTPRYVAAIGRITLNSQNDIYFVYCFETLRNILLGN